MTENQGFHVGGGHVTINAGALAAGPHATANHHVAPAAPAADLVNQVNLLLALIREHRATLADPDVVEQIALKVRAELTSEHPDRGRVIGAIGRLTQRVAAVGALAAAGARLEQGVHALLG